MKKWAIPIAATAIAVVAVAGAAFALTDSGDDNDDEGARVSSDADSNGSAGEDSGATDCASPPCDDGLVDGGLATCIEGTVDCNDTIQKPVDNVCIQIFPTPPECADLDAPVSNDPPVVDDLPPNSCDLTAAAADCEKVAVALATEDLAGRLGGADGITVQSVEFVEWPDSCLGISLPNVACAEVITSGFKIVLVASGEAYEYHTDTGSRAVIVE